MPRKIHVEQHEQQKTEIAEAVWRLAARAGLESVSLREVAAEAGISMGRVQHYFRTKDAMLLYGLQLAQRRMTARIEQRLRQTESAVHGDLLRAMAEELLGENAETRQAVRAWVAFLGVHWKTPRSPNNFSLTTSSYACTQPRWCAWGKLTIGCP